MSQRRIAWPQRVSELVRSVKVCAYRSSPAILKGLCIKLTTFLDEVDGLKDTIGGGAVLDDSEGYTRSSNKEATNAQQAEDELDAKVEAASS